MKMNRIDFNVVTHNFAISQTATFPPASHHGPRRWDHLPLGQGARAQLAWDGSKGTGRTSSWRVRIRDKHKSHEICSLPSRRRWGGFHAFQLSHSGFFHFPEIPGNGP